MMISACSARPLGRREARGVGNRDPKKTHPYTDKK